MDKNPGKIPSAGRRSFLKTVSLGAVTLGTLGALATLESCNNNADGGVGLAPLTGQKVKLALASYPVLQTVGGFLKSTFDSNNAGNPVLIVRVAASGNGAFRTMSTVCTHAACLVNNPSAGQVYCACHGSTFGASSGHFGVTLGGPAPTNLHPVVTSFDGPTITITF
jgi:thiosulfate dehydrogenase [quinone] large subunit